MFGLARMGTALTALAVVMTAASAIEVKLERVHEGSASGYFPYSIQVTSQPEEKLVKEPQYTGKPLYVSIKMGNGPDSIITVALDDDAQPAKVYIDANNDEDLTNDGAGAWERYGQRVEGRPDRYNHFTPAELSVEYKEGDKVFQLPYWVNMYRFFGTERTPRDQQNLFCYPMTKLKGTLTVGGKSAMVALMEDHISGDFSKLLEKPQARGIGGVMIDYNGDGKIATDARMPEMLGAGRVCSVSAPFHFEGKSYAITAISPSGQSMTVSESDAKTTPPVFPEIADVSVGKMAPLFAGPALDGGKDVSLKDLRGKVVLLDFWATWCIWCEREIPNVTPVWNEYKDKDFVIVGINLDDATRVSRDKVVDYAAKHQMAWRHLYRGDAFSTPEVGAYDVKGIPAMFLLDKDGKIIARDMEIRGPGKLEAAVKAALGGKSTSGSAPDGTSGSTAASVVPAPTPAINPRLRLMRPATMGMGREAKFSVGKPAPAFTGMTPDGKQVSLADYKGKVVLVDFMGSWCGPCRGELPHIAGPWEKYKGRDFQVISIAHEMHGSLWSCAVDAKDPDFKTKYAAARQQGAANEKILASTDGSVTDTQKAALLAEGKENFKTFMKNFNMTWTAVLDGAVVGNKIYSDYGIFAYPTMVLIDREGKVIATGGAPLRGKNLAPAVEAALDGKPQPTLQAAKTAAP